MQPTTLTPTTRANINAVVGAIHIDGQPILTERLRQTARRYLLQEQEDLQGYDAIRVPGDLLATEHLREKVRQVALMLAAVEDEPRRMAIEHIIAVLARVWWKKRYDPATHLRFATAASGHLGNMRKHFPATEPTPTSTEVSQ